MRKLGWGFTVLALAVAAKAAPAEGGERAVHVPPFAAPQHLAIFGPEVALAVEALLTEAGVEVLPTGAPIAGRIDAVGAEGVRLTAIVGGRSAQVQGALEHIDALAADLAARLLPLLPLGTRHALAARAPEERVIAEARAHAEQRGTADQRADMRGPALRRAAPAGDEVQGPPSVAATLPVTPTMVTPPPAVARTSANSATGPAGVAPTASSAGAIPAAVAPPTEIPAPALPAPRAAASPPAPPVAAAPPAPPAAITIARTEPAPASVISPDPTQPPAPMDPLGRAQSRGGFAPLFGRGPVPPLVGAVGSAGSTWHTGSGEVRPGAEIGSRPPPPETSPAAPVAPRSFGPLPATRPQHGGVRVILHDVGLPEGCPRENSATYAARLSLERRGVLRPVAMSGGACGVLPSSLAMSESYRAGRVPVVMASIEWIEYVRLNTGVRAEGRFHLVIVRDGRTVLDQSANLAALPTMQPDPSRAAFDLAAVGFSRFAAAIERAVAPELSSPPAEVDER